MSQFATSPRAQQPEEPEREYLQTLPLSIALTRWVVGHWSLLLLSLPCLFAGAAVWVLAYQAYENHLNQVTHYLDYAQKGVETKDFEDASLCYQRAIDLGAGSDEVIYKLAKVYQQQEAEAARGFSIIRSLAPLDRSGYAPAHLDMAGALLNQPKLQAADVQQAESHLRRILDHDPNSVDANSILGQIYARTGRLADARDLLFRVMNARPRLMLQVAALERALGRENDAQATARQAVNTFTKQSKDDPADVNARLSLAAAMAFVKDFKGAEWILKQVIEKENPKDCHAQLANVYLAWADELMKNRKKGPDDWFPLLEKALAQGSDAPILDQFRLIMAKNQRNDAETNDALREFLASTQQKSPGTLFLLGLDAWEQKRTEEARKYMSESYALDPDQVGVANNLAWILSTGEDPDLPRALEIINKAIEKDPGSFEMYGTRGRVLVRMQKYREALIDLEKSLRQKGGPNLHSDLADAYDALGMADLASLHRRKSTEARAALESAKRAGS